MRRPSHIRDQWVKVKLVGESEEEDLFRKKKMGTLHKLRGTPGEISCAGRKKVTSNTRDSRGKESFSKGEVTFRAPATIRLRVFSKIGEKKQTCETISVRPQRKEKSYCRKQFVSELMTRKTRRQRGLKNSGRRKVGFQTRLGSGRRAQGRERGNKKEKANPNVSCGTGGQFVPSVENRGTERGRRRGQRKTWGVFRWGQGGRRKADQHAHRH